MTDLISKVESQHMKEDIPPVEPGDTVRVAVRTSLGDDTGSARTHTFEGTVVACRGGGINRTITVRRVSFGVGVERSFPLHSPAIVDVEIVRRGRVRRAKLYYLRDRHERAARLRERKEAVPAGEEAAEAAEQVEEAAAQETEATTEQADAESAEEEAQPEAETDASAQASEDPDKEAQS